jgi:hypothetical protein
MRRVERLLRNATAPSELDAQDRAWDVTRSVYLERSSVQRRRSPWRWLPAPVAIVLAAALALTPAVATVHRWIDRTLGVKHARPALFSLPAPGQILVAGRGGVWTIAPDGSKRRLGAWSEATWSPHALYVAVARHDELAALNPRGVTQWSIARPGIRLPRWYPPSGYRVAYLSAGALRVIAGDGTGDRQLAGGVAGIAPAWRPGHAYQLAYVRGAREIVLRDADSGALAWSHLVPARPRLLAWSSGGERLLVLTPDTAFVYDGSGRRLARIPAGRSVVDGALSPDGHRVALLGAGELTVTDLGERTPAHLGERTHLFTGVGLSQLAWSPNGQWLLVAWPAANQWVFLHASGRPRILAVSRIAQQFGSFPMIQGWCCTAGGGAS